LKRRVIPSSGLISNQNAIQRKGFTRIEKARKDMQQTIFYTDPAKQAVDFMGNPHRYAQLTAKGVDPYRMTTCPFCLGYSRLRAFLQSTKKGFNRKTGRCPLCGKGANLTTLVAMETWTPEEYAKFVFDYRSSGFWQKINFNQWKDRLKIMGWTRQFWDTYKELRGDSPDAQREKELEEQWKNYDEATQHDEKY